MTRSRQSDPHPEPGCEAIIGEGPPGVGVVGVAVIAVVVVVVVRVDVGTIDTS